VAHLNEKRTCHRNKSAFDSPSFSFDSTFKQIVEVPFLIFVFLYALMLSLYVSTVQNAQVKNFPFSRSVYHPKFSGGE